MFRRKAVGQLSWVLLGLGWLVGCTGSSGNGGNTTVVAGTTNASVTCSEVPYQSASGITVSFGLVNGSVYVQCSGQADSFDIVVILVRDGVEQKPGKEYTDVPYPAGYEASTFVNCVPGDYHVFYRYVWTLAGASKTNSITVTADRKVTADDCNS